MNWVSRLGLAYLLGAIATLLLILAEADGISAAIFMLLICVGMLALALGDGGDSEATP